LFLFKLLTSRLALASLREVCLYTEKCWGVVKFDVIAVYETQQQLFALSYFDIIGRTRLSFTVTKGLLTIPLTMLNSSSTSNHEILCGILVRLICFVEGFERRLQRGVGWIG
jgi:hypothetical protein